jgi:MYXO-CTERM domain-containing protein
MEFQMRNKTFISSMVGVAAAVAVAGSANAGVAGVSLWDFRDFSIGTLPVTGNSSTSVTGGNSGVAEGNPFPRWETALEKTGTSMTGSGGKVNVVLSGTNNSSATFYLSSLTPVNLTGTTSFDINVTSTTGRAQWGIGLYDVSGKSANMISAVVTGNSVGTVSIPTSGSNWVTGAGFDWSQVMGVDLGFSRDNTVSGAVSFSFDSFTAVGAVPAPGALALLGVAGIVGARRRRA